MNKKSKYNEFTRLYQGKDIYILGANKLSPPKFIPLPSIPYLYFNRTLKTGKRKGYTGDKYTIAHEAEKETFSLKLMREVIKGFEDYLNLWEPLYIVHNAYGEGEEYTKRLRLYKTSLERLGYKFIKSVANEEFEEEEVYYYERRI